jgi:butyrate kinase
VRVIRKDMKNDRRAQLALEAMEYTMVKWAAMMAGALKGDVDAILMTGGLAYDEELVAELTQDLQWIAPIYVYPGSYETIALAAGAQRVLLGEEKAKTYLGEQGSWSGFGIKEWES